MNFREKLQQYNPDLVHVPSGYKRYGHVMILRSAHILDTILGKTILELFPWCQSIYQQVTTNGEARIPELHLLAGEDNPRVIHKENGVKYDLDLSRITFSGGNRHLREQLVEVVNNGEFLVDMFAAVGNLSLQPLYHRDIEALLIEKNSHTFNYLRSSLKLNGLNTDYAIHADCRDLDIENVADRIFMGYHDVDQSHLKSAIRIANSQATLHLHPIVKTRRIDTEISQLSKQVADLGVEIITTKYHLVKSYAPGLSHYQLMITIKK